MFKEINTSKLHELYISLLLEQELTGADFTLLTNAIWGEITNRYKNGCL